MNAKNNVIMVSSETMEKLKQCATWMNKSDEEVLEEAVSDLFYELEMNKCICGHSTDRHISNGKRFINEKGELANNATFCIELDCPCSRFEPERLDAESNTGTVEPNSRTVIEVR